MSRREWRQSGVLNNQVIDIIWGIFDIIDDVAEIFEEERNSLEDVLFDEEDNFVEEEFDDDKFFVALRLSPRPEQLVKGYEFQMLNKWELFESWDCE